MIYFNCNQYIEQHNRRKQYIEQHNSLIRKIADRFCELYLGICLTTEEKTQKNLSQVSRRMPVGKEYTEQSITVNKNLSFYTLFYSCST
jgi:hypothetical protein